MALREIRRDENGNLQRIYEPRYEQQSQRYNFCKVFLLISISSMCRLKTNVNFSHRELTTE